MKRRIVEINEELCNGCELCVNACHEGAIEMIDGKARLVSDIYCDGLGDCLPACPTDAIKIIERVAGEYDQDAVDKRLEELGRPPMEHPVKPAMTLPIHNENHEHKHDHGHHHGHDHDHGECGCQGAGEAFMKEAKAKKAAGGGCPGSQAMTLQKAQAKVAAKGGAPKSSKPATDFATDEVPAKLTTWPVQLNLVNAQAEYLKGADLLIAADCTAFAYGNFHKDFIEGRVCLIGCPKLDDNDHYAEKLATILTNNNVNSITVVRMEVPCCSGIVSTVKKAMLTSGMIVNYNEVTIGLDGGIR